MRVNWEFIAVVLQQDPSNGYWFLLRYILNRMDLRACSWGGLDNLRRVSWVLCRPSCLMLMMRSVTILREQRNLKPRKVYVTSIIMPVGTINIQQQGRTARSLMQTSSGWNDFYQYAASPLVDGVCDPGDDFRVDISSRLWLI